MVSMGMNRSPGSIRHLGPWKETLSRQSVADRVKVNIRFPSGLLRHRLFTCKCNIVALSEICTHRAQSHYFMSSMMKTMKLSGTTRCRSMVRPQALGQSVVCFCLFLPTAQLHAVRASNLLNLAIIYMRLKLANQIEC